MQVQNSNHFQQKNAVLTRPGFEIALHRNCVIFRTALLPIFIVSSKRQVKWVKATAAIIKILTSDPMRLCTRYSEVLLYDSYEFFFVLRLHEKLCRMHFYASNAKLSYSAALSCSTCAMHSRHIKYNLSNFCKILNSNFQVRTLEKLFKTINQIRRTQEVKSKSKNDIPPEL